MTTGRPRFIPFYAENTDYPAGTDPWSGQVTKVDPGLATRNTGFLPNTRPPAEWFNWFNNAVGKWLDYLADVAFMNWQFVITKDVLGAALDTANERRNGAGVVNAAAKSFYDNVSGFWVITGSMTADQIYIGTQGNIILTALAATGRKFTFGCSMGNDKGLVIIEDAPITAGNPIVIQLLDIVPATNSSSSLEATCVTEMQARDCVLTPTGRVVVVGGRDGQYSAWYTDDQFGTITRVDMGAKADNNHNLENVLVGKDGILVAWTNANTAAGGDVLWYSEDDGVTWSARTAIGFDNILSGTYIDAEETYVFATADEIKTVTGDIIAGGFVDGQSPVGNQIEVISSFGSALLLHGVANDISLVHPRPTMFLSWDLGNTWRVVKVSLPTSTKKGIWFSRFGEILFTHTAALHFGMKLSGLGSAARGE